MAYLIRKSLGQLSEVGIKALGLLGALALAPFEWDDLVQVLDLNMSDSMKILSELTGYSFLVLIDDKCQLCHALVHGYADKEMTTTPEDINRLSQHFSNKIKDLETDFIKIDDLRPHAFMIQEKAFSCESYEEVINIAFVLVDYLSMRGYNQDYTRVNELGLKAAEITEDEGKIDILLGNVAGGHANLGNIPKSLECYEKALDLSKRNDNKYGQMLHSNNIGLTYNNIGKIPQAIQYLETSVKLAIELEEYPLLCGSLCNLGYCYKITGNFPKAIKYFEQSLVLSLIHI